MSEEVTPNGAGEQANAQAPETVEQQGQSGDEANATNARVLAESKEYKKKYQATKARLEELEKSKLQEQNQYKELWQKSEEKYETLYKTLVKEKVRSAVSEKAAKAGCVDVDALLKLGDAQLLQINKETLEIDGADVFVEEAKKLKPYLFQPVKAPTINSATPGGVLKASGVKKPQEMTKEEIMAQLRALK